MPPTAQPSSFAERMLACTLTFRDAPLRTQPVPVRFDSAEVATGEWMDVLMHEAREALQAPLPTAPERPYLHPVDVHTDEPGIVTDADNLGVLRSDRGLRIQYRRGVHGKGGGDAGAAHRDASSEPEGAADPPVVERGVDAASEVASKELKRALKTAQTQAAARERRQAKVCAAKEARAAETSEQREQRLMEGREAKECRQREKLARTPLAADAAPPHTTTDAPTDGAPARTPPTNAAPPPGECCADLSAAALWRKPPPRPARGTSKLTFFEHALPHDRHMGALARCALHPHLEGPLLRGEPSEAVQLIDGPPGTGKTRELVRRATCLGRTQRVLLCAPTNVGAANLYARCLAEGDAAFAADCALVLVPERVPPGTVVRSNDPTRRVVCTTISSRSGRALANASFDAVFVDEAGQCMEAWTWTLLRESVSRLVLAGDIRQLAARVSESGDALGHGRSMLERLGRDLHYPATTLTEQNRMAPELLDFPNREFYEGILTTGPHAPSDGSVEVVWVADGRESTEGEGTTSHSNAAEAAAAASLVGAMDGDTEVVLLTPYTAQVQRLLACKTGREVHTVDSFQGREADVVVLSIVRDGLGGLGFWKDVRRPTVALTRARRRLIIVASGGPERWHAMAASGSGGTLGRLLTGPAGTGGSTAPPPPPPNQG